jgi:hypothetical protein
VHDGLVDEPVVASGRVAVRYEDEPIAALGGEPSERAHARAWSDPGCRGDENLGATAGAWHDVAVK